MNEQVCTNIWPICITILLLGIMIWAWYWRNEMGGGR